MECFGLIWSATFYICSLRKKQSSNKKSIKNKLYIFLDLKYFTRKSKKMFQTNFISAEKLTKLFSSDSSISCGFSENSQTKYPDECIIQWCNVIGCLPISCVSEKVVFNKTRRTEGSVHFRHNYSKFERIMWFIIHGCLDIKCLRWHQLI